MGEEHHFGAVSSNGSNARAFRRVVGDRQGAVLALFWCCCWKRTETPFWRHSLVGNAILEMEKHCDAVRASFSHCFGTVLAPLMTLLPSVILPPFWCCFWCHWWRCRRCSLDAIMASFPLQRSLFRRSKGRRLGIIPVPFKCHFMLIEAHGIARTMMVLGTPSTSHSVVPFWGCRHCTAVDNVGRLLRRRFGAMDDATADNLKSFGATVNNKKN